LHYIFVLPQTTLMVKDAPDGYVKNLRHTPDCAYAKYIRRMPDAPHHESFARLAFEIFTKPLLTFLRKS